MFSLLKKMFGRKEAPAPPPPAPPVASPEAARPPATVSSPAASAATRPQVAVAQLSLAAIIDKFPEDLRSQVVHAPGATVTVALPLATIHKQLGSGSVKMSLASLYRQAPPGTFTQARTEDKRMVEVPLPEIFRHVDAQTLRRRGDQRRVEVPRGGPGLFGDKNNPFAIAPLDEIDDENETPAPAPAAPLVIPSLKPDEDDAPTPAAGLRPSMEMSAPATNGHAPLAPLSPASPALEGNIAFPITYLCEKWPEAIVEEIRALSETNVDLPAADLGAGLARGRVVFTWGQIRSWMTPAPEGPTAGDETAELSIPLKAVAPLFMAHSRPVPRRHSVEVDSSLPVLFAGVPGEEPIAPTPEEEKPSAPVEPEPQPAPPAPLAFRLAVEPEPAALPAQAGPVVRVEQEKPAPRTLGELFGEPEKEHWNAQEIIAHAARLPGVTGAILALQEGLLVAAHLPEEIKGDTVAAFLPQIFARLNHYTGEMKLGDVSDVRLTLAGSHFHAWHIGEVYFAVLVAHDAALPAEALRLVVQELTAQAPK